jgi:AcrR family transcriptional regulator
MELRKPAAPRGRPRAFDTEEALDRAMRVFWRKGYLGTTLSDLTDAMQINRPSLYAAFGDKESLFRKALERYVAGPSAYQRDALDEPTARAAAERILRGVVELATDSRNPPGCLAVHSALSCGDPDDPLGKELSEQRAAAELALRKRFRRAISEGDLRADTDPAALARFVQTVNLGIAVQAATGATRAELLKVVDTALRAWPS